MGKHACYITLHLESQRVGIHRAGVIKSIFWRRCRGDKKNHLIKFDAKLIPRQLPEYFLVPLPGILQVHSQLLLHQAWRNLPRWQESFLASCKHLSLGRLHHCELFLSFRFAKHFLLPCFLSFLFF